MTSKPIILILSCILTFTSLSAAYTFLQFLIFIFIFIVDISTSNTLYEHFNLCIQIWTFYISSIFVLYSICSFIEVKLIKIVHIKLYILLNLNIYIQPWYSTTTKVLSISIISKNFLVYFCASFFKKNFKNVWTWVLSSTYFVVHNTIISAIGTILYNRPWEVTHLTQKKLYFILHIGKSFQCPPYFSPWHPPFYSVLLGVWLILIPYIGGVMQYLFPVTGLFHLTYCLLSSSMLSQVSRFFLKVA